MKAHISPTASASYIFHGPSFDAVSQTADELIRSLNCLGDTKGPCRNCRQLTNGSFTNLIVLTPTDRPTIGIESIRSLVKTLSLRTTGQTGSRVVRIDHAETLTIEAQNALLKLIEEPPDRTVIFLLTTEIDTLLATVRSRCQKQLIPGPRTPDNAELREAASRLLSATSYQRLIIVKRLVDSKSDLVGLAACLQRQCLIGISQSTNHQLLNQRLQALEQFRTQLSAGVSARSAVERLTLSL
jgi:hypothetical protein